MKKENKIDKLFNENLHIPFVYDEQLWQEIEPALAIVSNRRKQFWLFSIGSFILLCALSLFLVLNRVESKNDKVRFEDVLAKGGDLNNNQWMSPTHKNEFQKKKAQILTPPPLSYIPNTPKSEANLEHIIYPTTPIDTLVNDLAESTNNGSEKLEWKPFAELTTQTVHPLKNMLDSFGVCNKHLPQSSFLVQIDTTKPTLVRLNFFKNIKHTAYTLQIENKWAINQYHKMDRLDKELLQYRKENESMHEAHQLGINLRVQANKLVFGTGISKGISTLKTHYKTIEHTYNYSYSYVMINPNYGNTSTQNPLSLIKEQKDSTVASTSFVALDGQHEINRLTWIQVPLYVGYQVKIKKLSWSTCIGPEFQWMRKFQGSIIDTDLKKTTAINQGIHDVNRFNTALNGQINFSYAFIPQIDIGVSSYYKKQLLSNFKFYDSKITQYGFGLFMGYHF